MAFPKNRYHDAQQSEDTDSFNTVAGVLRGNS